MLEINMKKLLKSPAIIAPPPPEKIIDNLSWCTEDDRLIEYIKACDYRSYYLYIYIPSQPWTSNNSWTAKRLIEVVHLCTVWHLAISVNGLYGT